MLAREDRVYFSALVAEGVSDGKWLIQPCPG